MWRPRIILAPAGLSPGPSEVGAQQARQTNWVVRGALGGGVQLLGWARMDAGIASSDQLGVAGALGGGVQQAHALGLQQEGGAHYADRRDRQLRDDGHALVAQVGRAVHVGVLRHGRRHDLDRDGSMVTHVSHVRRILCQQHPPCS